MKLVANEHEVGSLQYMTPNTLGKVQYVRYINFKRVQNKEHDGTKNKKKYLFKSSTIYGDTEKKQWR